MSLHHTLAERGIINILLVQPFLTLVSNFSDRQVRMPRLVIVKDCAHPPDILHDFEFKSQIDPQIGTQR